MSAFQCWPVPCSARTVASTSASLHGAGRWSSQAARIRRSALASAARARRAHSRSRRPRRPAARHPAEPPRHAPTGPSHRRGRACVSRIRPRRASRRRPRRGVGLRHEAQRIELDQWHGGQAAALPGGLGHGLQRRCEGRGGGRPLPAPGGLCRLQQRHPGAAQPGQRSIDAGHVAGMQPAFGDQQPQRHRQVRRPGRAACVEPGEQRLPVGGCRAAGLRQAHQQAITQCRVHALQQRRHQGSRERFDDHVGDAGRGPARGAPARCTRPHPPPRTAPGGPAPPSPGAGGRTSASARPRRRRGRPGRPTPTAATAAPAPWPPAAPAGAPAAPAVGAWKPWPGRPRRGRKPASPQRSADLADAKDLPRWVRQSRPRMSCISQCLPRGLPAMHSASKTAATSSGASGAAGAESSGGDGLRSRGLEPSGSMGSPRKLTKR